MDNLHSILSAKNFDEPPEISSVKKYIQDEFNTDVSVQVSDKNIIINVPSASLASALRLRSPEINRRCQLDKKLIFRITG